MNENENIVKYGYLVEVVGNYGKEIIWEVDKDNIVEEPTDHDKIGLQGFDLKCSNEDKKGVGI